MSYLTHAGMCRNCFHLHHGCTESSAQGCSRFMGRRERVEKTLKYLEVEQGRTVAGLLAMLVMVVVALVWARL
jgi:hypothetical protein